MGKTLIISLALLFVSFATANAQLKMNIENSTGKVFYILQPGDPGYDAKIQHGLIAYNTDLEDNHWRRGFQWIEANELCKELGKGWHLPNIDELNKLYQNRDMIGSFKDMTVHGLIKGLYWSSSEGDYSGALAVDFRNGLQDHHKEDLKLFVRAVRSF